MKTPFFLSGGSGPFDWEYNYSSNSQRGPNSEIRAATKLMLHPKGAQDTKPTGNDPIERGAALQHPLSFYETILGSIGEGIFSLDRDGLVVSMNAAAERFFGWTARELQGKSIHEAVHYKHRDGTPFPPEECRLLHVLNTDEAIFDQDDCFIRKDGTFFDVRYSSNPIIDGGETIGLVVVFRDVTERQTIENRLRESEERFSKFMQHLPGLAWIKDHQGRYVFANEAAQKAFQTPMSELAGKTDEDVFPPETAAQFVENDRLARQHERGRQTVETLADENGAVRHSLVSKFPIPLTDGQPPLIGGMAIDITEQKRAEQNHEFLFGIAEKIRVSRNADDLLAEIANSIGEYLEIHRCLFNKIDLETDTETVYRDYYRTGESVAGRYKLSDYSSITSESMVRGQTVVNRDSKTDERTAHLFDSVYGPNKELAYVAVPLLREGKWVASLWCSDDKPHDWTDQEIGLLEGIAERAWAAVERLRAEEVKSKLAAIVESSDDAIVSKDLNGIIASWNKGAEKIFGYTAEEVIGKSITIIIPDDRTDEEEKILSRIRRGESVDHFETVRQRKDGELLDISLTVSPVRDSNGNVIGASKVARDITARNRAERALRESEEKARLSENQLRLVTDSIPALVSYVGADERYKFVNKTYSEWFGLPKEKVVGKKLVTILGSRAYKELKGKFDAALAGESVTFEAHVHYKGAGNRFISGAYVPDISDDGTVRGFYALISDVSDLKRSEDLLRATQDRMRMLAESFTDYAIFSTDVDGKIDSWNPGAANMFGYSEDEVLGQSYEMLFTSEDVANGVPLSEMRTARKSGRASDERWQTRKDGTRFFSGGVMAPLHVGKTLSGYAKITSDLTEKQRYAEALEHRVAERTQELAAANAALIAEINERKTAELQKIEFLQRLVTSQEDQRQRIARDLHDQLGQRLTALRLKIAAMKEACEHDENLKARAIRLEEISQLLDSEVSFLAWELRPFALDELGLVDAIGTFVREWSKHYEIPAEFHSSGLANVPLDKNADSHLYRIAQEALNNIVKHAKANGVNVLLERTGEELILIVEDDGVGMTGGHESDGRKGGKGLGLEGMRERASLIGGALEIESGLGTGTTIYVRVPLSNGNEGTSGQKTANSSSRRP
jgi:PAS domain S-box-containing protein